MCVPTYVCLGVGEYVWSGLRRTSNTFLARLPCWHHLPLTKCHIAVRLCSHTAVCRVTSQSVRSQEEQPHLHPAWGCRVLFIYLYETGSNVPKAIFKLVT